MSKKTDSVTETPAAVPVITYRLESNGEVTRTDKTDTVVVATYEAKSGVLALKPEWAKFRAPVVRFLNEAEHAVKSTILEGDKPDEATNIPPAPPQHPAMGDKTPAYVSWMRKYKPAEFKALYGVTGKTRDGKLIATRKTHLTIKAEDVTTGVANTSWDADVSIPEGEEGGEE